MASSSAPRPLDSGAPDSSASAQAHSSARAAAEVIAITSRDDFLLELGEALTGGQFSVHPVDSPAAALEQLSAGRRLQLLTVDARDSADLRGDIQRLQSEAPHVTILVFASEEKQTALSLKGSNVFAVLPIPVDPRKTAAVFEGAMTDAAARRSSAARTAPERPTSFSFEAALSEPASSDADSDGSGPNKVVLFGGIAAAAVALIAVAAWFFLGRDASTPETPAAAAASQNEASVSVEAAGEESTDIEIVTPEAESIVLQGTVDELLEKARQAMRERRYTEPAGDNALLYYRSAANADPANGEALDGLTRVATVLASRFDEALAESRLEEAALALVNFKAARPRDPRVPGMETKLATAQVTKALADGSIDRAAAYVRAAQQSGAVPADQISKWRAEISRRQDEARQQRLVDAAMDRIRSGRLLEPANDSAKHYLQLLKDLPGGRASEQRIARELGAAYMRKARELALANQKTESDRYLAEARSVGVSSAEINSFQRDIAAARQRASNAEAERFAQLARERLREGKLTEPAQDSADFYLSSLQSVDSNNAALAPASRELAARLLERASAAARERRTAQMEADLALARKWGAQPKDIQAVQQLTAAAASRGTPASRPAAPSTADLQSRLKRTRYVPPEYPERALDQRIAGVVVVDYVVDVNGETRNVRVVSAEPAGVFDRAAINAVRRWRYQPVIVDNVPTEVPARASIRFALPE